jgi:hypothetical protein
LIEALGFLLFISEWCTIQKIPDPITLLQELLLCKTFTIRTPIFSALFGFNYKDKLHKHMIEFVQDFDFIMQSAVKSPEDCYLGMCLIII